MHKFLEIANFCIYGIVMPTPVPSITKSRSRLSQVLQQAGDLVSVSDVSRTLRLERNEAAKLLSRWQSQG